MRPRLAIKPAYPVTFSHAHHRVQLAAILTLIAILLGIGLSLRSLALPPDGVAWTLPMPFGSNMHVLLWTHDLAFSTAYTTGGLSRQTLGPLRLTVAYQRTATSPYKRLVVRTVPAWPLLIPAGMLGFAALRWWRGCGAGISLGLGAVLSQGARGMAGGADPRGESATSTNDRPNHAIR